MIRRALLLLLACTPVVLAGLAVLCLSAVGALWLLGRAIGVHR